MTSGPKIRQQLPLGDDFRICRGVRDFFEQLANDHIVVAAFDSEGTLPDRRIKNRRLKAPGNPGLLAETRESRFRQNDRVELPFFELPEPGADVSTDVEHLQVGAMKEDLRATTETAGPDARIF